MFPPNGRVPSLCRFSEMASGSLGLQLPRSTRVKNKTAAAIQITAEQILREARERQEPEIRPPKQSITDSDDLADYRLRRRKGFEDVIRRARWKTGTWVAYAAWEESQGDIARARSIWERVLEVDYRNPTLWLQAAAFEMRIRCINHARNIWDRAVAFLPRVDQLWYKYAHMEEILGNVAGARLIFERWMDWQPDTQGWLSYINFELRYNEVDRARAIYERFVVCHPRPSSFIKYAKFEAKRGEIARARAVYERAVDLLSEDEEAEQLFVAFAGFELWCKEMERARCIYRYALDHLPKGRAEDVHKEYVTFEKQYGDTHGIEDAIVRQMRLKYDDEVRKNPFNYDSWFDYIRLEENGGNKDMVRELYERAIANVPPAEEKRYWKRYIYLWINYSLYEELDAQDMDRTREVYRECLKLIPHKKFSFAKIWLMAAQFEIRQRNLKVARQILGNAIGMAPNDKIFKSYIEIELHLGNVNRCRILYEKYLEWAPANCYAWLKYTEFERTLNETERARALFELAIAQPALDMPELLWKKTKPWIMRFRRIIMILKSNKGKRIERCRGVFERAFDYFRKNVPELKEERAMLLEEWLNLESSFGSLGDISILQSKLPRKVKRKRPISSEDGTRTAAFEECMDYIFPDEVALAPNMKLLEAAYKWKKQKIATDEN
ncbi:hypothetical protein ZIOFF_020263 [Zingiber officinale]|uniref:Crooked neck protein n=1 Tax=Zingiber officinale TaxID=94328 RepID=A0A8J5LL65_ZINOF|nr:hypothetical protein ZIOFF_020263 [Zingiber officinale]